MENKHPTPPKAAKDNYRSFRGSPEKYDLLGAIQFNLLTLLGLRERHKLLDIDCGSLSAGRFLIPYLATESYYGTESNKEILEEAIKHELGTEIIDAKKPQFFCNDNHSLPTPEHKFDYILAHRVFTRAPKAGIRRCLQQAKELMAPETLLIATFSEGLENLSEVIWVEGLAMSYTYEFIETLAAEYGLLCQKLDWEHPASHTWIVLYDKDRSPPIPALPIYRPSQTKLYEMQSLLFESQKQMFEFQKEMFELTPSECVFVLGCPRSGTSALSWALAEHPDFWTSSEANFFYPLVGADSDGKSKLNQAFEQAYAVPDGWLRINQCVYDEFAKYIGFGLDRMILTRSRGKRWVDSSPENVLIGEDLARMFPNAKFLHLVRDGRAVVCSMINSKFAEKWAADFEDACHTWVHYVSEGLRLQEILPERVRVVRQDDLVRDPYIEMPSLLEFLELDPAKLSWQSSAKFLTENRINSSYDNLIPENIKDSKSTEQLKDNHWERWSEERKVIFDGIAGGLMQKLGYI